jgi:hypothetical protein
MFFLSESFVCACIIKMQIASGILNIRIHRDVTGLPPSERIHPGGATVCLAGLPDEPCGGPARRAVWRACPTSRVAGLPDEPCGG